MIHEDESRVIRLMFNAGREAVTSGLPAPLPQSRWHIAVDTSQETPHDVFAPGGETALEETGSYTLESRSCVMLLAS